MSATDEVEEVDVKFTGEAAKKVKQLGQDAKKSVDVIVSSSVSVVSSMGAYADNEGWVEVVAKDGSHYKIKLPFKFKGE